MYRRPRKKLKEYVIEADRNVCKLCNEGPDEEMFGKFFMDESSGFSVHQYCMFFASGLAQRGEDDEGFDGFLIKDIKKEISRSRRLRCNFCRKLGATIGCCDKGCPQTFHYKCGRQRGGLFQFFDSFNSFCLMHRPTQGVNLKLSSNQTCPICFCQIDWNSKTSFTDIPLVTPCCKMTWFHNSCLQKHAQSSGSHYFRCPICNNMDKFQEEMKKMGIFIPEQDASWEKGDAFADLHLQYSHCDAKRCICPHGRKHNETAGEWHICLCDICGQAGTHVKCQHWRRSPREWYCDVCGDIHPHSSTRQRKIGDRSMDVSCIDDDDDDDESSSAEDLDVNVCSVSDDEISYGIVRDRDAVGTSHTLRGEGSVEKLVREGASPMRKRPRLSLECTGGQSPSFSGTKGHSSPSVSSNKEDHSNISLDTPTCSGTQFKDMPPEVLIAISDTIFSGVVADTIQGPDDMAKQWTSTSTKESETISMDSDTASEASVELIKIERKPELLDLKRRPIARLGKKSKSENYTSSEESVCVAGSESPNRRKQDLQTTEKRGIDVVEADSSAFSVKVEEGTEPAASEVTLPVADSKQDDVDSDEDSCIITNVVKKPCPVGNDKFGMKCYLQCCNPTFYCNYHQFLTSAKTKDLQITTVSSTSGSSCDHFVKTEKVSQAMEQHSLSDQASAEADNEEKAHVCSVGTNTLPFKPSSRKKQDMPTTETATTQSLFPEGKIPVSSTDRNKKLSLRSKKAGSYHERSLKGFSSLRGDDMAVTHKCFR